MFIGVQLICSFSHVSFPGIAELSGCDGPTRQKYLIIWSFLYMHEKFANLCPTPGHFKFPHHLYPFPDAFEFFMIQDCDLPPHKLEKLVPLLLGTLSSHADKNPLTYKNLSRKWSPATLVTLAWFVVEKDKFLEFFYKSSLILIFYAALKYTLEYLFLHGIVPDIIQNVKYNSSSPKEFMSG